MLKPSDTTQTITLKELLLEKLLVPKCYYNPDSARFCIGIQTNPHDNFPKCVGCKIGIWLHHFSLSTNNSNSLDYQSTNGKSVSQLSKDNLSDCGSDNKEENKV